MIELDAIELAIIGNLFESRDFTQKALPFLQGDYFGSAPLFDTILGAVRKAEDHDRLSTLNDVNCAMEMARNLSKTDYEAWETIRQDIKEAKDDGGWTVETLLEQAETWIKKKACVNAVMVAIDAIEGRSGKGGPSVDDIPHILQEAVSITFNTKIGHDYINDVEARWQAYQDEVNGLSQVKIPFESKMMNTITAGGINRKTLNMIVAGVNVGKTANLCAFASSYLRTGQNVFYATGEMSEEAIALRIDANILDIDTDAIYDLSHDEYMGRVDAAYSKINGRLFVHEFQTGAFTANDIEAVLKDLKNKKGFVPDVVIIDYIGIMASSRFKGGAVDGGTSFINGKSKAEELRRMAQRLNIGVWTAGQLTKGGSDTGDPGMSDIAESHGIPATCDFILGLTSNEDLDEKEMVMMKQIKTRYRNHRSKKAKGGSVSPPIRFRMGFSFNTMNHYDLTENNAFYDREVILRSDKSRKGMTLNDSGLKRKKMFEDIEV